MSDVDVEFGASIGGAIAGIDKVTEAIESMGGKVKGLTEVFTGLAEAFLAAFAVEKIIDWVEKISEAGAEVEHLTHQLGLSAEAVSSFQFAAEAMGISSGSAAMQLTRLERNIAQAASGSGAAASGFRALGITTQELKDHGNDMQYMLQLISEKFATTADGANKTAVAIAIGGRGFAQMIPLLDRGAAGFKEMADAQERAGTLMTGPMVEGMEKTSLELHEMWEAIKGVSLTIYEAFKPAIDAIVLGFIAVVESFNNALKGTSLLHDGLTALVVVLDLVIGAVAFLSTGLNQLWQVAALVAEVIVTVFQAISAVMIDATTGAFGKIEVDGEAAMDHIKEVTADRLSKMKAAWTDYEDTIRKLMSNLNSSGVVTVPPEAEGQDKAAKPQMPAMSKMNAGSKNIVSEWTQQLQELIAKQAGFFKDSTDLEIKFWQDKLATVKAGTKEYLEVEAKLYEAEKKQATQGLADWEAGIKYKQQIFHNDYQQVIALEEQKVQHLKELYGEDSRQYVAALREKDIMERQHLVEVRAMEVEHADAMREIQKAGIDDQIAALDASVADGRITNSEKLEDLRRLKTEEYLLELQSLQAKKTLLDQSVADQQKTDDQILQLERKHQIEMRQIDRQSATASRQEWQSLFSTMSSGFRNVITGMLQGTLTWKQALANTVQNLALTFIDMEEKKLETYLANLLTEDAATEASTAARTAAEQTASSASIIGYIEKALKFIATSAAETFAGVFAFLSGVMGPAAAGPATAAGALVQGAAAMFSMPSAAGGWEVSQDSLAMVHKREMILPADLSSGISRLIRAGSSGGGGTSQNGGTQIVINAMDAKSVHDLLMKQGPAVVKAARRQARSFDPNAQPRG